MKRTNSIVLIASMVGVFGAVRPEGLNNDTWKGLNRYLCCSLSLMAKEGLFKDEKNTTLCLGLPLLTLAAQVPSRAQVRSKRLLKHVIWYSGNNDKNNE